MRVPNLVLTRRVAELLGRDCPKPGGERPMLYEEGLCRRIGSGAS